MKTFSFYKEFLLFWLSGILAIYYIFSPIIHIPFYHHDSYKFSISTPTTTCAENGADGFNKNLSRYITAYTDCANLKYANTMDRMSAARIICGFLIAFGLALLSAWLYCLKFSFWEAFFFSGSIFLLLGMQTAITVAAEFIPITIILAFLGSMCLRKVYSLEKSSHFQKFKFIVYFTLGISFLMISFFSYPALCAFFLIPTLTSILFNDKEKWLKTRNDAIKDILIFCICAFVFFMIAKHHQMQTGQPTILSYGYDSLNINPFNRFIELFQVFSRQANFYPNMLQNIIIYSVLVGGILISLYLNFKTILYTKENIARNLSFVVQKSFLIIILLFLANIAYFSIAQPVTFGRIVFVFEAMGLVILVWAIRKWVTLIADQRVNRILFGVILGFLFLVNATFANYFTAKSALNDNLENNFLVTSIAEYLMKHDNKLKRVHIIAPNSISFNGMRPVDDIFNWNTTKGEADIGGMIYAALLKIVNRDSIPFYTQCIFSSDHEEMYFKEEKKCIDAKPKNAIAFTYSRPGKPIYRSPDMLIIDMNALNPLELTEKPSLENLKF